jgi:hypothetical protein
MLERALEVRLVATRDGKAAAESRARKVHHVVDETRHPGHAAIDHADQILDARVRSGRHQHLGRGLHGGQWIAQVVAQHGHELLLQVGALLCCRKSGRAGGEAIVRIEVKANQVGEQRERAHRLSIFEPCRSWIDGAQRAEHPPVGKPNRY